MCKTRELLLQTLIQAHLVRLLRVAPDLQVLDATTFAIQVGGFAAAPACQTRLPPLHMAQEAGQMLLRCSANGTLQTL